MARKKKRVDPTPQVGDRVRTLDGRVGTIQEITTLWDLTDPDDRLGEDEWDLPYFICDGFTVCGFECDLYDS